MYLRGSVRTWFRIFYHSINSYWHNLSLEIDGQTLARLPRLSSVVIYHYGISYPYFDYRIIRHRLGLCDNVVVSHETNINEKEGPWWQKIL